MGDFPPEDLDQYWCGSCETNPARLELDRDTALEKVGALEVQLADLKRQLVTTMEQARAAEAKASRLALSLEIALGVKKT